MNNIPFHKLNFKKNGVLASGILGVTGWSMVEVAKNGAGGITTKSISKKERKGHRTPVIQPYNAGVLNAVGLSSTGVDNTNNELKIVRGNSDSIIIASVFGETAEDFAETIKMLNDDYYDAIELNISCPNVADEFGLPFSSSPEEASQVVRVARKSTDKTLIVKLSPNFANVGITARACEDAGADGITAINTVGPGMLIDTETFLPKLSNRTGGLSGKAILPIAVRVVYDIYKNVTIPIIGMGGITSSQDAIQIIAAGATLYGVGTGIMYEGIEIFDKINSEIKEYLSNKKMKYDDLIGIAHTI